MGTLAETLGHLVDGSAVIVPGTIHDPAYPLVLGDIANLVYSVQSYDPLTGTYKIQVTKGAQTAIFEIKADGSVLLNGLPISEGPDLSGILAQCQAAAASANAAAALCNEAAILTTDKAASASDSADEAQQNADLTYNLANAPEGTPLPGGGDSAQVSRQKANTIAQESRELDISDPVTASETFQSGFFNTERQVVPPGSGEVVITMPPGLYLPPSGTKKMRWAAYKLASALGTVRIVAQTGGGTGVTPAVLKGSSRQQYRVLSPNLTSRHTLVRSTNVPAITRGGILIIFNSMHQSNQQSPTVNISDDAGLTWQTLRALASPATAASFPDNAIYWAPQVATPARTIIINIDEGPYTHFHGADYFAIDGLGEGVVPTVFSSANTTANSAFTATATGVVAQGLIIASASQGVIPSVGQFANFTPNILPIRSGTTAGAEDVNVADTHVAKNLCYGVGSGVATADGNFAVTANFTSGTGKGRLSLAYFPPVSGGGGGSGVQLMLEGGRNTLSVPYGVMEIWALPDGVTYHVRTPYPPPP